MLQGKVSSYLAAAPALSFVLVAAVLAHAESEWAYEAPRALLLLNTLFLVLVPCGASYLAARSTVSSGSTVTLLLGCSLLAIACSSFIAGWVRGGHGGANHTITIHNTGFLLAAFFNLAGSWVSVSDSIKVKILEMRSTRSVAACYCGIIAIVALLSLLTLHGLTPVFFVQEEGPTLLRQIVLALAVTLFFISALIFLQLHARTRSPFLFWYSLSLVLMAEGLAILLFQRALGSPINWLGRSFQYMGGVYCLIALIGGSIEARIQGTSFVEMLPGLVDLAQLRRAEEALRQSEERFRTLAEATFEGIAITEDGRFVDVNEQLCRITRYERSELLGMEVSMLLPVEEQQRVLQNILSGRESITEHLLIRRDGGIAVIEAHGKTLETGGGCRRHTAIRDITQQKAAGRELKERTERYELVVAGVRDAVWDWDVPNKRVFFSPQWKAMRGLAEDEADDTEEEWISRIHPEDAPRVMAAVEAHFAGQTPFFAEEYRILCKDGSWKWIFDRGIAQKDAEGRVIRMAGSETDITDRKLAEAALRRSESRFRLLAQTADRLLAADDPQAIVEELCQQAMEHLDCHFFFNFLVEEGANRLRLHSCAGIDDEQSRKIEWLDYGEAICGCVARERAPVVADDIFHASDLRTERIRAYGIQAYACHPLMARDRLFGTLSFGTRTRTRFSTEDLDVMKVMADEVATAMERKLLIEGLRQARDDLELRVEERTAALERSNQALQDFVSIASHDMKEPLRKVMTFGARLRQKYGESLGESGLDYLERIMNATRRMESLLSSLLDYSRVTTKAAPFSQVELRAVVRDVLSDLEVKIESTGAEVHVDSLPVIEADPTQMRQLFQNLVGNALKFHRQGDKPTIRVRTALSDRDTLRVLVEDNGIGFDEKYLDKVFAPFQRLHGRSAYEGTGMGLAICKKIVDRHEGTLTARSSPGMGSTFVITLPVTQTCQDRRDPCTAREEEPPP